MEPTEIKTKLIEEINQSNNQNLLEELYNYINQENKVQKLYKLSKEQKSAINEVRNQIKNNDFPDE